MVKELEDAPRDEVAVLLDGDARCGTDESFEVAVRAAGSILQAHVRRRTALRARRQLGGARGAGGDVARATGAARSRCSPGPSANAQTPAFALLQADGGVAARSLELVVVTSRVDAALVDRLVQRALSRRGTSLVYVEAEPGPEPQLLRLQAVGVPVAVVRPGDDLAAALAAPEARVA